MFLWVISCRPCRTCLVKFCYSVQNILQLSDVRPRSHMCTCQYEGDRACPHRCDPPIANAQHVGNSTFQLVKKKRMSNRLTSSLAAAHCMQLTWYLPASCPGVRCTSSTKMKQKRLFVCLLLLLPSKSSVSIASQGKLDVAMQLHRIQGGTNWLHVYLYMFT